MSWLVSYNTSNRLPLPIAKKVLAGLMYSKF